MRVQRAVSWIAIVGILMNWFSGAAAGQEIALAARTPRFFYASSAAARPVEIEVNRSAALGRVVSLHVEHATVGRLLAEIQRQTGLTFAYDPHFPATRPVTLEAESITVAAALGAILVGTGVDVVLTPTGHAWLTESGSRMPQVQEGSIVGRVTDKQRGNPIIGATVALEPTGRTATTASDGRYQFLNLAPGSYAIRTRYIGYAPLVASVAVSAGQDVTVDFPLQKSPHQLDEIVTTGTVVPTEVKALPTPITVIASDDIAQRRPQSLSDVIRQAIPSAVAFDVPTQPVQTNFSVRGASSLTPNSNMKIFVDGVEVSNFGVAPVDPSSIERIEVVRGPQAATIYGADAAGGVVQIFTKRGATSVAHPQVDAQAEVGVLQTPYPEHGEVLRQSYTGAVRGGGPEMGFTFGGSYTRQGDYAPNEEISKQESPSVYGGMRVTRGIITADLSARYYVNTLPVVFNPLLQTTGVVSFSRPNFRPSTFTNETYGTRITVAPTSRWQNQITMGVDRQTQQSVQARPRFTTPADSLYNVSNSGRRKLSLGYNTSLAQTFGANVAGTLIVGVDHYEQEANSSSTTRALRTEGTIVTSPAGSFTESRATVTNTGYFGQLQASLWDALFLTGGLRAEESSTFGRDLGTPVLPRVGLSVVRQLGQVTVKVRGAYGRAIRAPSPGLAFGGAAATQINLANPLLAPEEQQGWDVGTDLAFGDRVSLSVSGYDQTAKNLIANVQVATAPLPTFQNQNIGRVKNRGIEVEATLTLRPIRLTAQYGYVRSRIENLGSVTGSTVFVGDRPLGIPAHTAGAMLAVTPLYATTLTAGLTYVGSFRQIDGLAQLRCSGRTGPCQPTIRDYVVDYPKFTKLNAAVTHQLTHQLQAVVSVDNLTNSKAYEGNNTFPVMGRITTVGLHITY